jgi:hypothetical protein
MSRKFNKLANSVTNEYMKKGYSKQKASYIGKATAGKVARQKGKKK